MREVLAADVNRLTNLLVAVCERHRRHRDYTRRELRQALCGGARLPRRVPDLRAARRGRAVGRRRGRGRRGRRGGRAERARPGVDGACSTSSATCSCCASRPASRTEFALRFQQLDGPGDGQGRGGHRLLPLQPAGRRSTRWAATPGRFGTSVDEFHADNAPDRRATGRPPMLATVDPRHQAQRGRAGPPRPAVGDPRELGRGGAAGGSPRNAPPQARRHARPQRRVPPLPDARRRLAADAERAVALHGEGGAGGQGPHVVDRPEPGLRRRPLRRRSSTAVLADPAFTADLAAFVAPLVGAGRVDLAGPDAAQADRRPACPTSTRAPSCGTSAWSTPTTAARSTTTRAAGCSTRSRDATADRGPGAGPTRARRSCG